MRYLASYDFACEKASGNKIDYLRGETVYTIRKKPEAKWIVKNKLSAATWVPGVQETRRIIPSKVLSSRRFFAAHRIGKSTNFS